MKIIMLPSADLPLLPILSVHTDLLPLKFGKIQICAGMRKGFLYISFRHTDFFPKILIFLVIYIDFVLGKSGRSA